MYGRPSVSLLELICAEPENGLPKPIEAKAPEPLLRDCGELTVIVPPVWKCVGSAWDVLDGTLLLCIAPSVASGMRKRPFRPAEAQPRGHARSGASKKPIVPVRTATC